ncbi:DgyrCDS4108 [Dimorphilus gyrociliatus]|uniref:DgyrCDS4108 n=1 Tax=Dimorphilus gyrociliatus TaxID=2664684 RepID=A0A7I8VFM7_9ANNE|nr:DgyrCDS4108 [Dimorphilus gyrociliatus]
MASKAVINDRVSPRNEADMKPLTKKKYEEEMRQINKHIQELEETLKSNQKIVRDTNERLRDIRNEKTRISSDRKAYQERINKLNDDALKISTKVGQLQENLPYKNESHIDDTVRNLEGKLRISRFSLSEEKRIVEEIDKLKRSKKVLMEFKAAKASRDKLQAESKEMKKKRDDCYAAYGQLKKEEETLKENIKEINKHEEADKKKLELRNAEKQKLTDEFHKTSNLWRNSQKEGNQKKKFNRKEEKRCKEFKRERKEAQPARVATFDPITLCGTLIQYLNRQFKAYEHSQGIAQRPSSGANGSSSCSLNGSCGSKTLSEELSFFRKKDDCEVDDFYAVAQKATIKKKKNHLKKNQLFKISPEMLEQFEQLNLPPPANVCDIPQVLEKLHEQMNTIQRMVLSSSLHDHNQNPDSASESAISTSGFTTSIPSTPEGMDDIPRYPSRETPDSGLDETDGILSKCSTLTPENADEYLHEAKKQEVASNDSQSESSSETVVESLLEAVDGVSTETQK